MVKGIRNFGGKTEFKAVSNCVTRDRCHLIGKSLTLKSGTCEFTQPFTESVTYTKCRLLLSYGIKSIDVNQISSS